MSIAIKLPALGENIDSATVAAILVSAGDNITDQQPIMEVDTEKAAIEVPASAAGTVKEILVKPGDVVEVGQTLLTVDDGRPAATAETRSRPNGPETAAPPVSTPPPPSRKESPRPTRKEPPPASRKEPVAEAMDAPSESAETVSEDEAATEPDVAAAAPSLRRMARELGVDINEVTGTGPGGRITEDNVRNYARSIILNASSAKDAVAAALPDFSRWGNIERKPLSGVRRKIAEHMQEAWSIPHVTHFDSADITDLEEMRKAFSEKIEKAGGKLTMTAIALKVTASALKRFPQVNATFDGLHDEIIVRKYIHIGVAVDTERGLLVPVIRDADKKNIVELSVELTRLAEEARTAKLRVDDMQGGSFSITNLGGIGGTNFTPIINSPEAAILGISRANHQAMYRNGQLTPRLILPLALSFDHRVIDGADAARFLRWIAEALERPFLLALEG
jgi:pyruvate dehydrogenase E2 component (dihydrolipoamide acetyltransferase)